jgi:chorismate-pyruvate lyase
MTQPLTLVPVRLSSASEIEFAELSLFQQILLTTDGTLTKLLELYADETIQVVKLGEATQWLTRSIEPLHLNSGDLAVDRQILLQGSRSRRNWLYAQTWVVPQRLPSAFQVELMTTQAPIGKLWLQHKIETFKEIITTYRLAANGLAAYFQIAPEASLLCRTYRVLSNQKPVMLITERFPESYYR